MMSQKTGEKNIGRVAPEPRDGKGKLVKSNGIGARGRGVIKSWSKEFRSKEGGEGENGFKRSGGRQCPKG